MAQKMEMKGGDIYINDRMAWYNPDRSGILRGINAHHCGNELWVNGKLVYVDLEKDPLCFRKVKCSDIETTHPPPPSVSKLRYYDSNMILSLLASLIIGFVSFLFFFFFFPRP
jgi:hypothetical protein